MALTMGYIIRAEEDRFGESISRSQLLLAEEGQ